jgi:hypothetical protein
MMFTKTGTEIKKEVMLAEYEERGQQLTEDFLDMLNRWHSIEEPYDKNLEAYIHKIYYEVIQNPPEQAKKQPGVKYFTPSSADGCKRELFHQAKGDKRDDIEKPPHQGRWQRLGTATGDMIQKDLLAIHKHYKNITGMEPAFKPLYTTLKTPNGDLKVPFWEDFGKKAVIIDGVPLNGQPDGLLKYKDGSTVGLEIKSKQTSYSTTGHFSMKGPEPKHVKQVVCYSLMYGVDEFLIVYGNLSKKGWVMDETDLNKYPDLRCFYVRVTEDDKQEVLNHFKAVLQAVKEDKPPKLDVTRWTFNNYKTAIAETLTDEEIKELEEEMDEIRAKLDAFDRKTKSPEIRDLERKLSKYTEALAFIYEHGTQGG